MEGDGDLKGYSPEGSAQFGTEYQPEVGQDYDSSKGAFGRWMDGFKRDPNAHTTPKGTVGADGNVRFNPASDILRRLD